MPMYIARRIQNGRVTGVAETESNDDSMAWNEAHEGLDVLKGEWAEVKRIVPKQEHNYERD